MDALDKAISAAGSQSILAAACGVGQSAVGNWKARKSVPPEYCAPIEAATGQAVRRWDLRPDDWFRIWPELIATEGAPPAPTPTEKAA